MGVLDHELQATIHKKLKDNSKNIDSQFTNIQKHIKAKRGVICKDEEGQVLDNAKGKKKLDISGTTLLAKPVSESPGLKKLSIPEYREKFDS